MSGQGYHNPHGREDHHSARARGPAGSCSAQRPGAASAPPRPAPPAPTHVQDVAGPALVPLEHRLRGGLRRALRQAQLVGDGPVHDGRPQRKVGGDLHVSQAHAGDRACLVALRQPPLDAVTVVRVPRGQDHRVDLRGAAGTRRGAALRWVGAEPRANAGAQHPTGAPAAVPSARRLAGPPAPDAP